MARSLYTASLKMDTPLRRLQSTACLFCRHAQQTQSLRSRQLSRVSRLSTSAALPRRKAAIRPAHGSIRRLATQSGASIQAQSDDAATAAQSTAAEDLFASSEESLLSAKTRASVILGNEAVPSNEDVLGALETIEQAGSYLVSSHSLSRPQPAKEGDNATSALFSLAAKHASPAKKKSETAPVRRMIDSLSQLAYDIVIHPPVFLSPEVLAKYVEVQVLLLRPDTLPDIFDWYANKPTPTASQKDIEAVTYRDPNPKAIAAAIDDKVANRALDAALHVRDLPLALSIVETTFRAPSYRRAKIFKKAIPPLTGAALAPVAAWTLASQLASIQTGLSTESFQSMAFAGMSTYVLAVGTIGYVALTTANDQMQRVTWAVGMPLRTRWLREEERAALDRIAIAWGFREKGKWGEEEGQEWDEFKEWLGVRGMILDKVGLMEGME